MEVLDEMTGPRFTIFVVDRFKEYLSKYSSSSKIKKMGAVAALPTKEGPFDIARHFGITAEDVPCMVFFQHIEDTDVMVYPLDSKWDVERLTKEFKGITSDVYGSISKFDDSIREDMTELEWNTSRKAFWTELCKRVTKRRRIVRAIKTVSTIGTLLKKTRELIS